MDILKKAVPLTFIVALVVLGLGWNTAGAAEKKMTYQEYQALLAEYAQRESTATAAIAELQKEIDSLREQIKETDKKIAAVEREIYDLIQADETGVKQFDGKLDRTVSQIQGLRALSARELYKKREEIKALRDRFNQLKANPICYLPEICQKVDAIEQTLAALEAAVPKVAPPDQYTVVRGDCLWYIAKKKEIYGDPYLWPWIYRTNRDKIKDPDLIYPGWVLTIPRGVAPGQHLVVRGEWLSKIAGYAHIYGDPTKWTKIYQANRDRIKNPNLIYPAQVLEIPQD
ncbi:MAG: hypothetical protein B1H40_00265 [Candidatus Latescibacteria bacterium 4484_181]|nr:MAG: hypothetical protein B1H40_00265 [Candidatus Latescibacteria bacterium 4484_181]